MNVGSLHLLISKMCVCSVFEHFKALYLNCTNQKSKNMDKPEELKEQKMSNNEKQFGQTFIKEETVFITIKRFINKLCVV